jgi:hypothetical protein
MTRKRMETAEDLGPDAASKPFGARAGDTRRVGAVARDHCAMAARWPHSVARRRAAQAASVRRPARPAPVEDILVSPPGPLRSKPQTPRAGRRRDRRTCGSFFRKPSMPRGVEVRGSDAGSPARRGPPESRAPSDFFSGPEREHDLFRKPVSTPDQVRGRLFRDHAPER